jgi:hypothetical protein
MHGRGAHARFSQILSREIKLQHAQQHEYGTGAESRSQAEKILRQRDNDGTQGTANIDADVKDGERGIETRAALRI